MPCLRDKVPQMLHVSCKLVWAPPMHAEVTSMPELDKIILKVAGELA